MKDNSTKTMDVKYYSKCLGGHLQNTKKCDKIKVGDEIQFEIEITATSCDTNRYQTMKIYPVGINESLTIDIELICECACDRPDHVHFKTNSSECQNHGTQKCGVCECDEGFTGRKCECAEDFHNTNDTSCVTINCSNRGNCVCGVCECNKRSNPEEVISGKYCECDNFSCARHNGLLCSGHGTCKCGECVCALGWNKTDCSCSTSTDTCRAFGETELCSGHGVCQCGECKCENNDESTRSGRFCEKCPTCSGRCQDFKDCVQCDVYGSGPLSLEPGLCKNNCTKILTIEKVDKLREIHEEEQICKFFDENKCGFQFAYNDRDENKVIIRAEQTLSCPPAIFSSTVIFSIVGSIVLIGLVTLLLWKCITTIQDRKEFARFEEERKLACWDSVRYRFNFFVDL